MQRIEPLAQAVGLPLVKRDVVNQGAIKPQCHADDADGFLKNLAGAISLNNGLGNFIEGIPKLQLLLQGIFGALATGDVKKCPQGFTRVRVEQSTT